MKVARKESPNCGRIFKKSEYKFYKACLYYFLENYEKVIYMLFRLLKILKKLWRANKKK